MKTALCFLCLIVSLFAWDQFQPRASGCRAGDWVGADQVVAVDKASNIVLVRLHRRAAQDPGYWATALTIDEFKRMVATRCPS
jgi:hypothetical protein